MSKQTSLQHGLQQSQVDHVEQQQAQNGEVHYDGNLNAQSDYSQLQNVYNPTATVENMVN